MKIAYTTLALLPGEKEGRSEAVKLLLAAL